MSERVLPYEDALAEVLRQAASLPGQLSVESVALAAASGRVLAEPIAADRDQPPFPRSTRDGFAVRSGDLERNGVRLALVGSVRAGERWTGRALGAGQAIEIMTGAPVPDGADTVLMVEHAALTGGELQPEPGRRLSAGENVVPAGAEARAGAVLIPPGRLAGVAEVGLAASCGYVALRVFRQPAVAIVATGDELVEVGTAPEAWQIRNSNSYTLAALVEGEAAEARRLAVARDTREDLRERLREAQEADLVLFSGGVSMGKYDLVEDALREAGAEFLFTGARIQPGKPVVFGRLPRQGAAGRDAKSAGWTYFFGLPGNPISTEVCFRLFAAPLLRALGGRTELAPRFAEARLAEDVRGGAKVTRFLPALVEGDWAGVTVRPVPWQGSGDLAANARANGFVVLPLGVERFSAGETVRVLLR
ncbi:MAG TPA: gephyrin-like molybdotransferase Glp [Acidobacteriaceae bacterium]|nr:gephyrin-like molybdotransferase Glp [Acidobacteriaceae bacterium]